MSECDEVGSAELGRRWASATLQTCLRTPETCGSVYPPTTAMELLQQEEETDGKRESVCVFLNVLLHCVHAAYHTHTVVVTH